MNDNLETMTGRELMQWLEPAMITDASRREIERRVMLLDSLSSDEKITPAALEACGFTFLWAAWRLTFGDVEVQASDYQGRYWVAICDEGGYLTSMPQITTIGALRHLLAALSQKDTVTQPNPASDEDTRP